MNIERLAHAIRLSIGVPPISTFRVGIKHSDVKDALLLIVFGEGAAFGATLATFGIDAPRFSKSPPVFRTLGDKALGASTSVTPIAGMIIKSDRVL